MSVRPSFVLLLLGLITAGLWGGVALLDRMQMLPDRSAPPIWGELSDKSGTTNSNALHTDMDKSANRLLTPFQKATGEVRAALEVSDYQRAVTALDRNFEQLSSHELEALKQMIFAETDRLILQQRYQEPRLLMAHYLDSYDELEAWARLAAVAERLSDWPLAVEALRRSAELEFRPVELEALIERLVQAASFRRAELEKQQDELSILALYQELYTQLPGEARFQFELAQSYLRLGDIVAARPLLEPLRYDPEFGRLVTQNLEAINELESALQAPDPAKAPAVASGGITVPLIRSGNSFLVRVSVNNQPLTLLLDTGASITALNSRAVSQLNLRPTGRQIRLNTANGTRKSSLFLASEIRIGALGITDVPVAEIDLANEKIQGLLGTDLLNQFNEDYSYIIDNQQGALIFTRR